MPPPGTEILIEREGYGLIIPISRLPPKLATRFESTHCSDGSHNGFHVISCDLSSKYLWVDLVKKYAAVIHWNSDLKALGWETELTTSDMDEVNRIHQEYNGERRKRRAAMEMVSDAQAKDGGKKEIEAAALPSNDADLTASKARKVTGGDEGWEMVDVDGDTGSEYVIV